MFNKCTLFASKVFVSYLISFMLITGVACYLIGGRTGLYRTILLHQHVWQLKRAIAVLNRDNEILRTKIKKAERDPLYTQRIAREVLQFCKEGEIVYVPVA